MTSVWPARILILWAGLMGAAGVALAAASAHLPDATRLASASTMLLFHAPAALAALLLIERGMAQRHLAAVAAAGLALGASLFAGDLVARHYLGAGLFPMAAPTGGTTTMAGWLLLGLSGLFSRRR
jgi:uncharacterized protein (TIGR03382 family)